MNRVPQTSCVNRTWCVLNWNIRGVNAEEKWPLVFNKIEESSASIVCLQETKKEDFDLHFIRNFAPKRFDKYAFVPSEGASGGLLILWPSKVFTAHMVLMESFGLVMHFSPLFRLITSILQIYMGLAKVLPGRTSLPGYFI